MRSSSGLVTSSADSLSTVLTSSSAVLTSLKEFCAGAVALVTVRVGRLIVSSLVEGGIVLSSEKRIFRVFADYRFSFIVLVSVQRYF